jgi:hypothetical protein
MKFKNLLIFNAIVLGLSGFLALVFPSGVLSFYGVESGAGVQLMAQYAGLGSMAIALVAWFSRNVKDPKAQIAVSMAFLITYIIGAIVSVLGTISGTMNIGWMVVGLYLFFSLAYGYILFIKRD